MPARRTTRDADPVWVYVEVLGVRSNVARRSMHVLQDLFQIEFRLAAVDYGKHRVAALEKLLEHGRAYGGVVGEPAAANARDDARAVGVFFGSEHVHRQRSAEFAAVNHVLLARVRWGLLCWCDGRSDNQN